MFQTVLIANRGAIAVRILRTLKALGVRSVAVYAEADAQSPHVLEADLALSLGAGSAAETYLNQEKILQIVAEAEVDAVHPGYGFLSENAEFCRALEERGVAFIGPTAEQMRIFGLKHEARALASAQGVPLLPGSALLTDLEEAYSQADQVGYPVMLKSTAGGGGIGMQVCQSPQDLQSAWHSIKRLSANNFGHSGIFLEKYIEQARHVEVQVFGDGAGAALVLGDRDCSVQRRHQKVIEEAPAPGIPQAVREQLHQVAHDLVTSVAYRSAGTVEFIYDAAQHRFYFLEMNTRLQVEHGVTEMVFSVDLVAWMVRLAAGDLPALAHLQEQLSPRGHAVQARIYAENPSHNFQPCAGTLNAVQFPPQHAGRVRIDHWVMPGLAISPLFDPMLAKVIAWAEDREQALAQLSTTLEQVVLEGIETNCDFVQAVLQTPALQQGAVHTRLLQDLTYSAPRCDVLEGGTLTTVQDYPGRVGYWHVGVPPSGPFDSYAFRLGNRLLGNDESAAGLEITLNGPTLKFHSPQRLVLTGAPLQATLDGQPLDFYQVFSVQPGQVLTLGALTGAGARAYCLFAGGLRCQPYLGARATFTLGQFGGLTGRALRSGDVLHLSPEGAEAPHSPETPLKRKALTPPVYPREWTLRVIYGPHGAPDFFTEADIEAFFAAQWAVHYNSSRTGVRLIGPKPQWARTDGGEAGMHPSNIHDNAYALGTIDFTGDMPVILGPDGPSLGGFVCPATVITADMWMLGQLAVGDKVRFEPVGHDQALALLAQQERELSELAVVPKAEPAVVTDDVSARWHSHPPVLASLDENLHGTAVVYRCAGDHNLLVEYGPQQLDIVLRFRVHALMLWLQAEQQRQPLLAAALLELTPGVRSLQVHYQSQLLSREHLLELLQGAEAHLEDMAEQRIPARIVHLPLSWDDEQCRLAVTKYEQSVRKNAPWCPDNIEFIRRINGLDSVEDVKRTVFSADYVVMGLGDVYLGAPLATPLDPRHRLVTTKYNPARTWTAENSVGIGGAYMCVYGMEGPGGYQFVGRTLQMWNRHHRTEAFKQPWLLRFFDQIRFYEVSPEELVRIRRDFPLGRYPIKMEDTHFCLADYQAFLRSHSEQIEQFTGQRQQAFQAELDRWVADGQMQFNETELEPAATPEVVLPPGCSAMSSPVTGSVWQWSIKAGDRVSVGEVVCVLESMKMEIEISATCTGIVRSLHREAGQPVTAGQTLLIIEADT